MTTESWLLVCHPPRMSRLAKAGESQSNFMLRLAPDKHLHRAEAPMASHGYLYLGLSAPLASPITLHRAVFAWPWIVPMLKSRNVRSALAGTRS